MRRLLVLVGTVMVLWGCGGSGPAEEASSDDVLADALTEKTIELQGKNYVNLHPYEGPVYHRGKLSWRALATVKPAGDPDNPTGYIFRDDVEALAGSRVKIRGYMIPLEAGQRHARFLLSPDPKSCPYCSPDGPVLLMEVVGREPIMHTYSRAVLEGTLEVLKNDPHGLLYRLKDAERLN